MSPLGVTRESLSAKLEDQLLASFGSVDVSRSAMNVVCAPSRT